MKKNLTIDDLAVMIQNGFSDVSDRMATKKEMNERFQQVDERINLIVEGMDLMRADIHDIKLTLGPLVRTVAQMEDEIQNFHLRISRLEKKVGIGK